MLTATALLLLSAAVSLEALDGEVQRERSGYKRKQAHFIKNLRREEVHIGQCTVNATDENTGVKQGFYQLFAEKILALCWE